MTKKIALLLLAAAIAVSMTACSGDKTGTDSETTTAAGDTTAESGDNAGLANPVKTVDNAAAIESAIGVALDAPKDASDVGYSVISDTLGQVKFTYEGNEYTYRAAKELTGTSLHGVYYEYGNEKQLEIGGNAVTAAGFGADGSLGFWTAGDYNYSLYTAAEVSEEIFQTALEAVIG